MYFLTVLCVLVHLSVDSVAAFRRTSDPRKLTSPKVRSYWMRRANEALNDILDTPCPFFAYGSVIVNHTGDGLGQLVCIGANSVASGNPVLHGEIAAITNCSSILTDPNGPYGLTGEQTKSAWADLTLYTNAEPCPMCAAAIRWAGFKELVFGTDHRWLQRHGWPQMSLSAEKVFSHTHSLGTMTNVMSAVLTNETEVVFGWQYNATNSCPDGCSRVDSGLCEKDADAAAAPHSEPKFQKLLLCGMFTDHN